MLSTKLNNTIKVLEARLLEHSRDHVILEVAVVEWQSKTVETQGGKVLGVLITSLVSPLSFASTFDQGTHVKKYSNHLSKKYSYFSGPRTFNIALRCWNSCPGYPARYEGQHLIRN